MRGRTTLVVVGMCLTGLVGCSSGGDSGDPQNPASGISVRPTQSTTTQSPSSSAEEPTAGASTGESTSTAPSNGCPNGVYEIEEFTGKVPLPGTDSPMRGDGDGLRMTFADGTWTLTGDSSETSEVEIGEIEAELTVDGSVEGTYDVRSGSTFEFTVGESTGKASVAGPGVDQKISMDQLALALTPSGTANVLCSGEDLTLDSETITLEMERA